MAAGIRPESEATQAAGQVTLSVFSQEITMADLVADDDPQDDGAQNGHHPWRQRVARLRPGRSPKGKE